MVPPSPFTLRDLPDPASIIKGPCSELLKSPCQGLERTQLSKATLMKATFLSFHLRKTDIWVDWKVGRCPIWLGTGCVNPKAPLLGQAGLAHSSRPAVVGSSCLPEIIFPSAWHRRSSPQNPGPSLYLQGEVTLALPLQRILQLSLLKTILAASYRTFTLC